MLFSIALWQENYVNETLLDFSFPLPFLQDDEINQQSQLVETLKQQMLDQEEVTLHPPCLPFFPSFLPLCLPAVPNPPRHSC